MSNVGFAMGDCVVCHRTFTFNPHKVPSTRIVTGTREPVCMSCMTKINNRRRQMGKEPFKIMPGAYEPGEISVN
jgi:predicted CXXCH cytochrome family protein